MGIEVKNIGFYYNKNSWILKDINMTIKSDEILGICGYSGSGKTTLARLLANHMKASVGEIIIDGEIPKKKGFQKVQLINQHPEKSVNPKWKMKQNLEESYIPSQEILDRFEIKDIWLNRWPIELSGGELQRFCIVRALNPNTKYLIADEMTTMLDAITQAKIWHELVAVCREREMGLIVISHEAGLVERLCDRVIYIEANK